MTGGVQASDEALVIKTAQGCMESFGTLYERYKTPIYRFVARMLRDTHGAEDVTHDVFIRLHRQASRFKPSGKFSTWLFTVARNATLDYLRKKKIRAAASLEAENEDKRTLADVLGNEEWSPERIAASNEAVELIRNAVDKLEARDREAIVLCDLQGVAHEEAAKIAGCRTQTLTVRLYRARRKLAKILKF